MAKIIERFKALQQTEETLGLYALVDGYQFERHTGQRLRYQRGANRPILMGTADAPLAHAGPWLIDVAQVPDQIAQLETLEETLPSVSWLITSVDLEGLSQLLQLKLHAELPDGRKAMLRFYDPRVLGNLFHTMNHDQRGEFFRFIVEWHFHYKGQGVVVGSRHA